MTNLWLFLRMIRSPRLELLRERKFSPKSPLVSCSLILTLFFLCSGGDVLILEEAAYCDEGFFVSLLCGVLLVVFMSGHLTCCCVQYETVAPILSIGTASLVAISTLTSEIVRFMKSRRNCAYKILTERLYLAEFLYAPHKGITSEFLLIR